MFTVQGSGLVGLEGLGCMLRQVGDVGLRPENSSRKEDASSNREMRVLRSFPKLSGLWVGDRGPRVRGFPAAGDYYFHSVLVMVFLVNVISLCAFSIPVACCWLAGNEGIRGPIYSIYIYIYIYYITIYIYMSCIPFQGLYRVPHSPINPVNQQ